MDVLTNISVIDVFAFLALFGGVPTIITLTTMFTKAKKESADEKNKANEQLKDLALRLKAVEERQQILEGKMNAFEIITKDITSIRVDIKDISKKTTVLLSSIMEIGKKDKELMEFFAQQLVDDDK